ncbi:PREDICTED: cleavage and polyadenylation specificity factor subunit 7 [Cyprinodon variegatus]|uniref:Cleavage and polyadenylation specific factor 7 n=1 Tax=Cyprinodon variegatus TaxID=28743 RepID=A0A3Q2CKY0_CYPVA|nr:PREDICTED: cleavage and polyadenylation specificity factor subunit 7 [Cyprinodon variegatus]XP_015257459.1 PREDICTED: cleavage and polyadenylation specificity factor subunit 7 [Cyprinodon variegatus]
MAAAQPAKGPSTSKSENVDLYSDLYPSDEDLDKVTEANELFDAVLTGTVDEDKKVSSKPVSTKKAFGEEEDITDKTAQNEGKRARNLSIYVGNFPWWTSDHDLKSLAQKLGVKDIADIKFAENKANGQSRGYAEVVVASEQSLKILLEKMPQFCINGEKIQCRFATQQNLSVFEGIANKRIPLRARLGSRDSDFVEKTQTTTPSQEMSALPVPPPLFPSHPFANMFPSPPTPFLGQPPPLFPHMAPMVPPLIPPPVFPPHPGQIPGHSPPELHINPPFFNLPLDGQNSKSHTEKKQTSYSENGDYEEQMNRNRAIASSAITKAVSGAASGDVHMAMETLITAISIIKESRVYEDEYCQALVTSLKDCLFSIQGDYSPKQSRHSREKDRDRGRDRDHERERDYERDRERDRERARERYRERDDAYDRKSVGGSRRYRERTSSEERDRERSRDRERHRDHRDRYH